MRKIINAPMKKGKEYDIKYFLLPFIIILTIILLFSFIALFSTDIDETNYYIVSIVAVVLSNIASSFIIGRKKRSKGLIFGVLYTLPSNVIVLLLSAYMNDFKVNYCVVLTFALSVASAALSGIASVNIKSKKITKR